MTLPPPIHVIVSKVLVQLSFKIYDNGLLCRALQDNSQILMAQNLEKKVNHTNQYVAHASNLGAQKPFHHIGTHYYSP